MANGHGGRRPNAGKKKGQTHEATRKAHEAIALAFDNIGGVKALTEWARNNPDSFYERVWPKIIPVQLQASGDHPKGGVAFVWLPSSE
jgi:hypothetical protein